MTCGGLVAHPTTGLWGIAADPLSTIAMARLSGIKGSASRQGFIVIAANVRLFRGWHTVGERFDRFAATAFEGPVTVVLEAGPQAQPSVVSEVGTVALRVDTHLAVTQLSKALGRPFTSTSLNFAGEPPAPTPNEAPKTLRELLGGRFVAGPEPSGTASTLVRFDGDRIEVLRSGVTPQSVIAAAWAGSK
jgi:L-threonylcarbamoyladenylate synthase